MHDMGYRKNERSEVLINLNERQKPQNKAEPNKSKTKVNDKNQLL